MRLDFGFQDKKRVYVLLGCVVLLLFAVLYAVNEWPSEETTSSASVAQTASPKENPLPPQSAAAYQRRRRQEAIDIYKIDPTLHIEKLGPAPNPNYTSSKRNLFRYEVAPPPPPPKKTPQQIAEEKRAQENRPAPPPPPPIELKYYGYATDASSKEKKVFLTNGQDIFIATEGEIIANRYRIVRIGVNSVEVEDLKNKNRQQLPLSEG